MLEDIKKSRVLMILILSLLSIKTVFSQDLEIKNDAVPLDESIRYGVLKNGVTYYVKPLENPEEQLKMIFLVKTGSFDEQAYESDFAHLIEHLAFKPSKNFSNGIKGNPELLSSLGMNFRELGGVTGVNFTKYNFNPPFDNPIGISTGLMWFRDIADGLDLSEHSINRERGVVLQEFLAGEATQDQQNSEEILNSKIFPCYESHQDYLVKNKTFPYQDLQEYYFKWYRPERMAIGIVGKIKNVDSIERLIKSNFENLKVKKDLRETQNCGKTYVRSPKSYAVVRSNPESLGNIHGDSHFITLFFRDPFNWKESIGLNGLKVNIKFELLTKVLNQRFKEKEKSYNNSSTSYSSHLFLINNRIKDPVSAAKIIIRSNKSFEEKALRKRIGLLKQFSVYGVHQEEFEEAKDHLLGNFDPKSPESLDYWTKEIINHFAFEEAMPTGKNYLLRKWIQELSKEDLNDFIKSIISPMPDDIGIIIPEGDNSILSSNAKTRRIIKNSYIKPVMPFQKVQPPKQLLSEEELHLLNVQAENLKPLKKEDDITTFKLKNGITIILRPLAIQEKNRNITLHGFSPYGANCFPKEDYFSAIYAPNIILNSGVGNFTKFDLTRYFRSLDSVHLNINPYIDYNEAGIKAEVSKRKLEELLQLVYLFMAKPRKDPFAFKDWKNWFLKGTSATLNTSNDLFDELNVLTEDFSVNPQASRSISSIQKIKLNKVYEIYKSLFGDVENFTFIVSGDYNEKEVLPLLQKYLGNLLSTKSFECKTLDTASVLSKGPVSQKINPPDLYDTVNSYYGVRFVGPQEPKSNWKEEIKVQALGYLASNLVYGLRAKDGLALYYFAAAGEYNRVMNRYQVSFRYVCNPEELPIIQKKTSQIIEKIKSGEVSNEVFEIAMNELGSRYDLDYQRTPKNTAERFYRNIRYDEPIVSPSEKKSYVESLEIKDLQEIAQKIFKEDYLYKIVMENENL